MKNPRALMALNGALSAFMFWLYVGDVVDLMRLRSSPVSAVVAPASLPFAVSALLATLVALALTVWGVTKKQPVEWKGFRVMWVVVAVALFADLFVLSSTRPVGSSDEQVVAAVSAMAQLLSEQGSAAQRMPDEEVVKAMVAELGDAPYFVQGEPAGPWRLSWQRDCDLPSLGNKARAGTLVLCLAAGGRKGTVQAIGLPLEARFGEVGWVTAGGQRLVREVKISQPAPPELDDSNLADEIDFLAGPSDAGATHPP